MTAKLHGWWFVSVSDATSFVAIAGGALFAVGLTGSAVASVERFEVRPHELPFTLATYPLVSGRYTSLVPTQQYGTYVLFDDRTDIETKITAPAGCELWSNAFAAPWLLAYCGSGPELYNIHARRWTMFDCGEACENTGVAAPGSMGSRWVEIDENAYCDPRYDPCDTPNAYVALPGGQSGSYTPSPNTLLDFNSRSLSEPICSPWSQSADETVSLDDSFVILQTNDGVAVGLRLSQRHRSAV